MNNKGSMNGGVLILGAGINGCAVARDLVANGLSVTIVEKFDIGWGATSRSSRLIHGGVRYLEYGEFRLVRESLDERTRLLRNAPQFVIPLTLNIPVRTRFGGLMYSILRFLTAWRIPFVGRMAGWFSKNSERGVWLIRAGLWMYDRFTHKAGAPRHRVLSLGNQPHDVPAIDGARYHWVCQYMDAQIRYPERLILAMLQDCQALAAENGTTFEVFNAATAEYTENATFNICSAGEVVHSIQPNIVVNATGAWGDQTVDALPIQKRRRMFGGTKGSHLLSHSPTLREALGEGGIYAEAADGRLIFILPFGESVMAGTTDVRFEQDPGEAIADADEIDYLIEMVNTVLPAAKLTRGDVDMHYSGVRPLPFRKQGSTAAISRDHSIRTHQLDSIPVLTLIGGKLTTCRAFGELATDRVLQHLSQPRTTSTADMPYRGAAGFPESSRLFDLEIETVAAKTGFSQPQVRAVFELCGTATAEILEAYSHVGFDSLVDTNLPLAFVRYVIDREWVRSLDDLVERRLMLLYDNTVTRATLEQLLDMLVESKTITPQQASTEIDRAIARLQKYYGRSVTPENSTGGTETKQAS